MTRTLVNRRAAAILTAALTLGVAGPAVARPIESVGPYSPYTAVQMQDAMPTGAQPVATHGSGNSDLEYLLIGAGGTAVVMLSLGGTAVATHRRRHTRITTRANTAA
jgi:hypothetical protein